MGFSTYLQNALLNHLMKAGTANYTSPTLYLGLSTTPPAVDGSNVTEPTDPSYARLATIASNWTVTANSVTNAINLVMATAGGAGWGACTYFVLYDTAGSLVGGVFSGGNLLAFGQLGGGGRTVTAGDTPEHLAGALTITIS